MTGNPAFRVAGTLADWQSKVAQLAVGNDRLALFMAAAFAGPLLEFYPSRPAGFTSLATVGPEEVRLAVMAASVWGPPKSNAQIRTWRGTANGLEGVATTTSDTLLILDEMGQADAREVDQTVYMLAKKAESNAQAGPVPHANDLAGGSIPKHGRTHVGAENERGRQAGEGWARGSTCEPAG